MDVVLMGGCEWMDGWTDRWMEGDRREGRGWALRGRPEAGSWVPRLLWTVQLGEGEGLSYIWRPGWGGGVTRSRRQRFMGVAGFQRTEDHAACQERKKPPGLPADPSLSEWLVCATTMAGSVRSCWIQLGCWTLSPGKFNHQDI